MEHLDHAHTSGHLELDTRLEAVFNLLVVLVIAVIVAMHHFHQLKLETTTSVIELIGKIPFGLVQEKAVRVTILAVHSTILHTSVYSSLLQPLTGLSYESALINPKLMRMWWCCLLKCMCSNASHFFNLLCQSNEQQL
jgi:hypothetical protein